MKPRYFNILIYGDIVMLSKSIFNNPQINWRIQMMQSQDTYTYNTLIMVVVGSHGYQVK